MRAYAVVAIWKDGDINISQDAHSRLEDAQRFVEDRKPTPKQVNAMQYKDAEGREYIICELKVNPPVKRRFWAVNTKFFDGGRVKVNVYPIYADEKPENRTQENKMCDEYIDYFDTQEEASAWAEQIRKA